ncbi:MAG TPA: hypothetical protein VE570_07740, partial [Thermoleophilaceae bacterium]|nr:hypothetical protein [Thermoleophilaceae bacterium]
MPMRLAIAALLALALAAAPAADAGSPGKWTQLGQANLANIDEASLARTADGTLHVVWTIPAASNDTLVHDAIAPNGTVSPPNVIQTGWASIEPVPDVVATPEGLRVFFGGIRTTDPNETNDEMNTATAPPSGATWDLFPAPVAKGDAAYGADGGAALLGDGTPLISWGGTGTGVFTHRGLDQNTGNFPLQGQLGGCCGYSPDIAVDAKSGAAFVAWYSNATDKFGVFAQSLDPNTGGPAGAPALMPGSTTLYNGKPESSPQMQRTPIAARAGGGVYVAYAGGYPTTNQVRLWRIADSKSAVVATSSHNHLASLAADPQGRLWVIWVEQGSTAQVFARRSNKSATRFGPAVKLSPPKGQQSAYKIAGNAQTGTLDVVAMFGGSGPQTAQWHTQILPA